MHTYNLLFKMYATPKKKIQMETPNYYSIYEFFKKKNHESKITFASFLLYMALY